MSADRLEFLENLANNLTNESKWFLWALMKERGSLHKEELRDIANSGYREHSKREGNTDAGTLVSSRHSLDIHTARLEGAGLVSVKEIGRVRVYSLTKFGDELLRYIASKDK